MAYSRALGRLSSRLKPLCQNLSNKNANVSSLPSPIKSVSPSSTTCRLNRSSRLPVELSSMIPLHSAIASSRLVSSLSIESKIWGLVPLVVSSYNKFSRG